MIWLASYPRSGNTFFRIILHEVYGIETTEFSGLDFRKGLREDYQTFAVVKTHLLPDKLVPADLTIPVVYLLRDGRDALVSFARYRSNIVAPGSNYRDNLKAAIRAREARYFGGWSEHVRRWRPRANLIIRFEDLVQDPIGCVEQLRPWIDLPQPRADKLPSFGDLKKQAFCFDNTPSHFQSAEVRQLFFRRGKVGTWKDEMPLTLLGLFYYHHGSMLSEMGYEPPSWRHFLRFGAPGTTEGGNQNVSSKAA